MRYLDLQLFANTATFDINAALNQMTRAVRRFGKPPTAAAIDLTVTPAFNAIAAPLVPTLTAGTAGALATGNYTYRVTALTPNGESTPSPEPTAVAVTGPNGSVAIAWTAVTGATGYAIYGRTAGAEQFIAVVGAVTTFTDTGAIAPSGALPATNTTGAIAGAVAGQVNAGDMVYRTANGGVASLNTPGVANANTASFLGVAEETYPTVVGLGEGVVIGRPLNDTHVVRIAIRTSGEFRFKTTPGDTYAPGDTVYLGLDAQTVQKTATGTAIGRVCNDQGPVGGDFSSTVTGAAGQEVVIEIAPPAAVNG